jgi:hypothetical protein
MCSALVMHGHSMARWLGPQADSITAAEGVQEMAVQVFPHDFNKVSTIVLHLHGDAPYHCRDEIW